MKLRYRQIIVRSLRVMWRYRLRSGLIVISAALGVAGVVCPVNYGEGGAKQLLDQVRRMGTNVLIITPVEDKAVAGRARTGGLVTTLVDRDLLAIQRDVTGLTRSSGLVTGSLWIKAGDLSKNAAVVGCEPDFFAIKGWPAGTGLLFTQSQERSMARVVLLGHTAALDLFGEESPVGRPLMINRVPFIVAGVLTERGQGLDVSNEDSQLYVPLRTAMHRLMNLDHFSSITIEVEDLREMDEASGQIQSLLHLLHRIRGGQADDFQIQNQKTLLETQRAAAARLEFLLGWTGGSALAVSGLGILGITWIAIKERTRDLATCRALGATAADVFFQVWFESTVLALLGGLLGLAVSWPGSRWIARSAGLPFVFNGQTAALSLAAAACLNLAFSLLPSRRAARLHPIEALRHE
jgi:putative ABC transport system permease protein